ncbi:hypothetical protein AT959_13335 [Dechloromonas denitrificans]|uniref:Uncharacterized protein n=1 Tax=Dechloromonas denitrificans TaxID=281362 RepID=A0A133XHA4_9RHOO|nr:SEC-C metal-binding domain-containing protein [Dechloromonas denitrificans]KXB30327.1 hypothetical protein AT959_13335 [Dechloromonas denitrificans]
MQKIDQLDWQEAVDLLCFSAARLILEGISFAEFRDRMEGMVPLLLKAAGIPQAEQAPEMLRGMATAVALEMWNATPIPDNRFRPLKRARPERNAPCLCGSGRKFKQCCGMADMAELGVSEELMLSKVLASFSRKRLLELPLLELSPQALAGVAHDWLENGRAKDAVALLEKLFTHLPELDERAEWAADELLNAYLEVDAPRKKQKFIDALKAAPDKMLRSAGWQRQTTVHSDRGDYAEAWEAFREAQRLTPNAPALSHLEVLVLVSEGRRAEAQARAKFWAARLARDQEYDHSDLIALLHDLAEGSDESLLRTLSLGGGPVSQLAAVIEHWPAPASEYRLAHGAELTAKARLEQLESAWMDIREEYNLDGLMDFLAMRPLAGQSFMVLRDLSELLGMLPDALPGSKDALTRRLLERSEALRQTVLGKLKALEQELPWGFLFNRPLLTLVCYYVDEFAASRPAETLDLLRWSVNVANPNDNTGLRENLIHALVAQGLPDEAIAVAARYPDDFASTEFGRVLALFAAGRLGDAEAALKTAAAQSPKVWKMLHAANPKMPRMTGQGITVGGNDEAWLYRSRHLDLWRSTGALKWGAGIKLAAKAAAKPKSLPEPDDRQNPLF